MREAGSARIEARGVTVRVGERVLVAEIDLDVQPGEIVAVAGPIGAGKSTLVRALAGLVPLAAGRVRIEGDDLAALSRREAARRVAVVFQESPGVEGFLVRDVVDMGRHPWIEPWRGPSARDAELVGRALADSGVEHLADRVHATLSGGEKQLVQLARAMAQEPRVLLLDEPAASLDLKAQWMLGERIAELAERGLAILFTSHDLGLVRRWSRRVLFLKTGRLAGAGATEELVTHDRVAALFDLSIEAVAGSSIDWG